MHSDNTIPTSDSENNLISRFQAFKLLQKKVTKFIGATSLAALGINPLKAQAQTDIADGEIARALNLMTQFEFMQEAFYNQALESGGLLSSPYRPIFAEIRSQHINRVVLLKDFVFNLGYQRVPQRNFNFTAGGQLQPFNSFDNFLGLAQIIEDASTAVYKSQTALVYEYTADANLKQVMLRLHSVDARHAYYIRNLRARLELDSIKGWISASDLGTLSDVFPNIYAKEDNTQHSNINVANTTSATRQAVAEAWDEPLSRFNAGEFLRLFTTPLLQNS